MSLLVGIALTAISFTILEGIGLARNSYLSSKSRRQDVAKLWSTCIRTFGLILGLTFGILWLFHQQLGISRTQSISRVVLLCNIVSMQGAFVFETTRSYSGGEAKVRKGLALGCIACCQVPSALIALSTLFALPPHLRRPIEDVARYMPPAVATIIQSGFATTAVHKANSAQLVSKPHLYCLMAALSCSYLLNLLPFWLWTFEDSPEMEARLGKQVAQLVLMNWPPAYFPPIILVRMLATEEGQSSAFVCIQMFSKMGDAAAPSPSSGRRTNEADVGRQSSLGRSSHSVMASGSVSPKEMV